jgi:hypothetical protein
LGSCPFLLVNLHLGIIYYRISLLHTFTTQLLFLLIVLILHFLECFIGFHAILAKCCVTLVSHIDVFDPASLANILHLFIRLACVHDRPLLLMIPPSSCSTVSRSRRSLSLLSSRCMTSSALRCGCKGGINMAHRGSWMVAMRGLVGCD